ncbi:MAG: DUF996 domain-containing protein [Candidatus Bathyarchaeia archaeon]
MNVNFEQTKKLAGEGAILLLLSVIPYVGWVLGIIGIVLLMKSMKEFSDYYHDQAIYQNAWTGLKYYIVAIVAVAVAGTAMFIGVASATAFTFNVFTLTAGFGIGLIACLAGLVVAFVFYVLAASHLKDTFNTLAEKSGDQSLSTAGTLLWVGSLLTIIGVGLVLIFVAWIFAAVGFFGMKNQQYPQYSQTQPYNYSPPQQPAQPINPQTTA